MFYFIIMVGTGRVSGIYPRRSGVGYIPEKVGYIGCGCRVWVYTKTRHPYPSFFRFQCMIKTQSNLKIRLIWSYEKKGLIQALFTIDLYITWSISEIKFFIVSRFDWITLLIVKFRLDLVTLTAIFAKIYNFPNRTQTNR